MRKLVLVALAALMLSLSAAPAFALLRVPQVAVQGTGLQQLFNGLGQTIDVATQQHYTPGFTGIFVTQPPTYFIASHAAGDGQLSLYNVGSPSPLFLILPSSLPDGWHAAVTFDAPPERAIVQLFDAAEVLQGTTTHTGVNLFGLSLAVSDASGSFYADDPLNPGGSPRLLSFLGTGSHSSDVWLAVETDGDGDFMDAVFLLQFFAPVPVERETWGALKRRFR